MLYIVNRGTEPELHMVSSKIWDMMWLYLERLVLLISQNMELKQQKANKPNDPLFLYLLLSLIHMKYMLFSIDLNDICFYFLGK